MRKTPKKWRKHRELVSLSVFDLFLGVLSLKEKKKYFTYSQLKEKKMLAFLLRSKLGRKFSIACMKAYLIYN